MRLRALWQRVTHQGKPQTARRYADPHDRAVAEMCGLAFDHNRRRDQGPSASAHRAPALNPEHFHIQEDGGGGAIITCPNCGSTAISYVPAQGWSCSNCGASDSDE